MIARYCLLFIATIASSHAQMGGGPATGGMMGGGPGRNPGTAMSGPYLQMVQSMGNAGMMGSSMGVGMTEDLAIGPDGVAYVTRPVASTGQVTTAESETSWQYELAAISPADGSIRWRLPLPGGRVSALALASDGLIYLTVDDYQMFYANYVSGGSMMNSAQAQANEGKLLVISSTISSASIMRTIQTASDVLSVPRIVPMPSGGYMIYVLGYDIMSWTQAGSMMGSTPFAPGRKTLYAYLQDGSLKFSVKLGQATN